MKVKFKKVREVKTPTRANPTDAGIDFFIPDDYPSFTLLPGESVNIPSGVKLEIPPCFAGIFMNKSGVAKKGLVVGACVVDCGYQGEVHLNIHNVSLNNFVLNPGQKITQLLIMPVSNAGLEQVSEDYEFDDFGSDRGIGGFGSSGVY